MERYNVLYIDETVVLSNVSEEEANEFLTSKGGSICLYLLEKIN